MSFELKPSFRAERDPNLIASVDLGSNSFRMVIAQIIETPSGYQLRPVDTLRDSIKLAAGLDSEKKLDADAFARGINSIKRFGERLKTFHRCRFGQLRPILYASQEMPQSLLLKPNWP
jgi:exopolyphosphatase/guanosine-5'-triphosphate,3'-diphosphate pyrophosphatase